MSAQTRVPLVEMKDISLAFGGVKAVDHASLDLYPGEVVGRWRWPTTSTPPPTSIWAAS